MKTLQKVHINPANAILVIVDAENYFCHPDSPRYTEAAARVLPHAVAALGDLADRCRNAGVPVIYIQSVRTLQEPEFTLFGRKPCLEIGTWDSEIIDELKPHPGDIIVQKFCHDAFYRTELDEVLQKLVPDPLKCHAIVTGGGIAACLFHAVQGFYLRNYWTVVPIDCTYYGQERSREIALELYSRESYPNIFLSQADMIEVSSVRTTARPRLAPNL